MDIQEAKELYISEKKKLEEQYIRIDSTGTKCYHLDRNFKILHREDGPAIEQYNGTKAWYIDGKYHREDGPAIEYANGDKEWYIAGKKHRLDGPAIEYADGDKEWYVNGKKYTEKEFEKFFGHYTITNNKIKTSELPNFSINYAKFSINDIITKNEKLPYKNKYMDKLSQEIEHKYIKDTSN